ncbi:MAG: aminoacetone oxidase family FAD-binding enzyme [Lentisphaeraceae bacterium]|nr:aminoacetone oxidase family FAD-binding enzyme [Lentisphaeraceae bacterium]
MNKKVDVIVIGAGAAGLMCAAQAAARGRSVLLLEHQAKAGRKIIISGGGRCNFTNMDANPNAYLSQNPHFCKSALKRYTQYDFLDLVDKHKIPWHEKKLGQLFCDNSAKDILNMLLNECDSAGVELYLNCKVEAVNKRGDDFEIKTSAGVYTAESCVIAAGGYSIPKIGASGFGFKVAKKFKIDLIPTRAALVPFLWSDKDAPIFTQLPGIALPCRISCDGSSFDESFLFTHKGLSGPAVLQISSFWDEGKEVSIDLLPDLADDFLLTAAKESPSKTLKQLLSPHFPKRFVEVVVSRWAGDKRPVGQIPQKTLSEISSRFKAWKMKPGGTEGYRTAEVTIGGVDTNEL